MDSDGDGSAGAVVRQLARLPIIDRVRVVKDVVLRELGGIHSHVSAVREVADALLANDWRVLRELDAICVELGAVRATGSALLSEDSPLRRELDGIHSEVAAVHAEVAVVHATAEALLANDSPLLQSSVSLVEAVQQARLEVDRQGQILLNSVRRARHERQRQIEGLLAAVGSGHQQVIDTLQQLNAALEGRRVEEDRLLQRIRAEPPDPLRGKVILVMEGPSVEEPEVDLMAHLYSYLPSRIAVDVGANVGDVSNRLLEAGYEVYAFEPNSATVCRLSDRLGRHVDFHYFPWALGSIDETRALHTASDLSGSNVYRDATLYSSLTRHSMPDDLVFSGSMSVTVRSLESLHDSKHVPINPGLVKIDTEGFDLEVIRGMGPHRYPVVVAEYWDPSIPFGVSGAMNRLDDMVKEMKGRGYHWYIVFYRTWGKEGVSFYCNHPRSLDHAYGNVFFFQEHSVFAQALLWCSAVVPTTYVGR